MKFRNLFKVLKGKYWLLAGSLTYLSATLSSIFRSIEPTTIGDNLYMTVDWFAACIVYFFLGALLGLIIDYFVARHHYDDFKMPLWAWLTIIFWAVGSLFVGLFSKPDLISPALAIFFPWAFGIFFVGFAFVLIIPDFIVKSFFGKLIFDFVFILIFAGWLWLDLTKYNRNELLRKILLIVLFLILTIGFVGCAQFLS